MTKRDSRRGSPHRHPVGIRFSSAQPDNPATSRKEKKCAAVNGSSHHSPVGPPTAAPFFHPTDRPRFGMKKNECFAGGREYFRFSVPEEQRKIIFPSSRDSTRTEVFFDCAEEWPVRAISGIRFPTADTVAAGRRKKKKKWMSPPLLPSEPMKMLRSLSLVIPSLRRGPRSASSCSARIPR